MSNRIFETAIVKPASNLAELAKRIDAEHAEALSAARASIVHARNAGQLLMEAKKQCDHGQWQPWLQANVKFSERTARVYMQVACRWDELESKRQATAVLTIEDGLKLLAEPAGEDSNRQRAADLEGDGITDVPPGLDYYRDAGLLDGNCIQLLLGLEGDYGPEIITPFKDEEELLDPNGITADDGWQILNAVRPLDMPTLWPIIDKKPEVPAQVLKGVQVFMCDVRDRLKSGEEIPQWEVTAFWYGSQVVHLAEVLKGRLPKSLPEILEHHLDVWRDSFRSALYWIILHGKDDPEDDGRKSWWGYSADLRHAGIRDAREAVRISPAVFAAFRKGIDLAKSERGYASPTSHQKRLLRQGA